MEAEIIKEEVQEPVISVRSNGLLQARIMTDGKIRRYFYGRTEEEIRDKIKKFREGCYFGVEESEIKFREYFNQWMLATKKNTLKPGSYDRLERTFRLYLNNRIGGTPIGEIKTITCQTIINMYAGKYTYSTVKKIYEAMNGCLRYAATVGSIPKNPMAAVIMPRESAFVKQTKKIIIPTEEEINKLFEEGSRVFSNGKPVHNPNYIAVYRFISETGLRVGEVMALTWDKISFDDSFAIIDSSVSEITNRTGKNKDKKLLRIITDTKTKNGNRVIYLNTEAKKVLMEVKERNEANKVNSEYVFVNGKGKPVVYHELQRTLAGLCRQTGIKPFGLHTLRHYFASRCVAEGAEMLALSKHLGHSSPSITMNVYAHLTTKQNIAFQGVLNGL